MKRKNLKSSFQKQRGKTGPELPGALKGRATGNRCSEMGHLGGGVGDRAHGPLKMVDLTQVRRESASCRPSPMLGAGALCELQGETQGQLGSNAIPSHRPPLVLCVSLGSQLGCRPQSYEAAAPPGSRVVARAMVGALKMPHGC